VSCHNVDISAAATATDLQRTPLYPVQEINLDTFALEPHYKLLSTSGSWTQAMPVTYASPRHTMLRQHDSRVVD